MSMRSCWHSPGLRRLGLESHVSEVLDPAEMLPAPGQGALAVQMRRGDDRLTTLLASLDMRRPGSPPPPSVRCSDFWKADVRYRSAHLRNSRVRRCSCGRWSRVRMDGHVVGRHVSGPVTASQRPPVTRRVSRPRPAGWWRGTHPERRFACSPCRAPRSRKARRDSSFADCRKHTRRRVGWRARASH